MFCSRCGVNIREGEGNKCWNCGLAIGQSRFSDSMYTSAQVDIFTGDNVYDIYFNLKTAAGFRAEEEGDDQASRYSKGYTRPTYTRTNYTSEPDSADAGDVDSRTTYRPAYGGDSIPEEMRAAINGENPDGEPAQATKAEAEGGEEPPRGPISAETASAIEEMTKELEMEGIDRSAFEVGSIESEGQAGISPELNERMIELESNPAPRQRRGRRAAAFGDYEDVATAPAEGEYAEEDPDMIAQTEMFENIDDDEFDELRHGSFGVKKLLKIIVALIAVAALFIGGVMWINYIRGSQSSAPIENVTEDFYTQGIALIKEHASAEYANKVLTEYSSQGSSLTALSAQLQQSAAAVSALLPEGATENDQLLMSALKKIETNIANCITSDAMAISQNDADAVAASDARWQVVENSISMLEAAQSAAELTAIINGEVVSVEQKVEATPTPEPVVNYNTLSKGDKSDEVVNMQNRLSELGYLQDTPDGAFGTKTQTAVKIFQQMAGLPVTGIADNATLNALYADDAPAADLAPTT